MAGMQWFYAKDGQQLGPVEFSEIERLHAAGEITGDTLVWQQGTASWVKLHTLLASPSSAPSVPAMPGAPVSPPVATPQTGTTPKTNTLAIISLVTGILGPFCCLFLTIAAIVCGHIARSQIKKNPLETGNGLAVAGLILGYIGLVWHIAVIIFYVTTMAATAASEMAN